MRVAGIGRPAATPSHQRDGIEVAAYFSHDKAGVARAASDMARPRVLIVEDHEGMRQALCGLFRRVGWEVTGVGTVAEGLAALRPAPECVVVDLHLPDGEGEAIVRWVKDAGLPTCVTVICTGTDDEARIRAVEALEPNALLRKPVEFEEVLAACNARPGR
jgi:DNA-binding response OmpR family regulator